MSSQEGQPTALPEASDVLVSSAAALVNLAGIRLAEKEHRNPPKAKEAIDAARALLALCPEDAVAPIKDALAQVQLLYVKEQQHGGRPPGAGDSEPQQSESESEEREREEREEREKARAKIWTPPGA